MSSGYGEIARQLTAYRQWYDWCTARGWRFPGVRCVSLLNKPQNWLTGAYLIGRHPTGGWKLFTLGGGYRSSELSYFVTAEATSVRQGHVSAILDVRMYNFAHIHTLHTIYTCDNSEIVERS